MLNIIVKCLDHILAKHPDSGIITCGDTNRLKDHRLRTGYQLKQLVKEPTRGRAILDRVYTNMYSYYDQTVVLPPIGLSDPQGGCLFAGTQFQLQPTRDDHGAEAVHGGGG